MITIHHLNNSRSQRILWLLEELNLPYVIKGYERDAKTMLAPASLKAIHPLGKSPVLTDENGTFAESGAIIEYVIETYGKGRLKPTHGTPEFWRYQYWLHYAEGSLMPPLLLSLIFNRLPKEVPFLVKPLVAKISDEVKKAFVNPQLKTHFEFIEGELAKSDWFAGNEFSAADIQMSFGIEAAVARGNASDRFPLMKNWLMRIHNRPAYKKAEEKGGPFSLPS